MENFPNAPPATPSRIPIPTQPARPFSSVASPTKASLSRHHPQLIPRPSSSGEGATTPRNRKNIQDVFDRALGATPGSQAMARNTQGGNGATPGSAKRRARSMEVGISGKPRRKSRSPAKQSPEKRPPEPPMDFEAMGENFNPFKKKGLKRSPVPGQADSAPASQADDAIPFKKTGLRRSPVLSRPLPGPEAVDVQENASPGPSGSRSKDHYYSQTTTEPFPSQAYENFNVLQPERTKPAEVERAARSDEASLNTQGDHDSSVENTQFFAEAMDQADENAKAQENAGITLSFSEAMDIDESNAPPDEQASIVSSGNKQMFPPEMGVDENEAVAEDGVTDSPLKPTWSFPQGMDSVQDERGAQEDMPAEDDLEPSLQVTHDIEISRPEVSDTINIPQEPLVSSVSQTSEINDTRQRSESKILSKPLQRQLFPPSTGFNEPSGIKPQTFQRQTSNRSTSHKAPTASQLELNEEAELPLTPTQRGIPDPVVTTPPAGIHNSPSKSARRSKSLSKKLKGSPLKPRQEPGPKPMESEVVKEKPAKRRKSARFVVPEDLHAAKKQVRDNLLKELQQLQADVKLANMENERLRLLQESRSSDASGPSNPEELLALLLRSTVINPPATEAVPVSALKATSLFLPFASRRKARPVALAVVDKSQISHLPLPSEDPLPLLQLFSPLIYTSTITLLPPDVSPSNTSSQDAEISTFQRNDISASHPSGLFAADFSLTVDTSTLSIADVAVTKLDPSAEAELGDFIQRRGVLRKDIGVICWAMGRWVEVAVLRARFWCGVNAEFGNDELRMESLQKLGGKRKRKATEIENDEPKVKWTRRQLLPYMGRTSMDIPGGEVELRIEWKVGFDWTGEPESKISASARLPTSWQGVDDRKSLKRIPEIFDRLVKEKGPLAAVRIIVGLTMSG